MSDKPSFAVGEVRRPSGRRGAGPVGTGVFRVFDLRPGAGMIDYLFLGADTSREGAERAAAAFTRIFERSGEVAIERHLRRCMRYCDLRALIVEMAKFTRGSSSIHLA